MDFETERLRLRPWTVEDAEAAFAIYGDPEVAYFIRDAPEESVETQRETLERIAERFATLGGGYGFWAIEVKGTGVPIGSAILKPLPGHEPVVEVGWHLGRAAWGKGYATESARRMIEYGFNELGLTRLVAVVRAENHRSLAVARRLRLRHEGKVVAYGRELELFATNR